MAGQGQDIRRIAELAGRDPDRLPNVANWQPRADAALQAQVARLDAEEAAAAQRRNPPRNRQLPERFREGDGGRRKKSRRRTRKHKKTRRHHRKH
jgi:hypothetical protein